MIVIKRLSDAIRDGDTIHSVIKGTAINNDGSRKIGFAAPSVQGQADVIAEALAMAEVDPETITYVEAHGTGTRLGDPIEAKALATVLSEGRSDGVCAVGSVKTNIGHLEAAAGIASLIKVALSLKHRAIPASLHFHEPNPLIPFDKQCLRVQQEHAPWPRAVHPALAGVSSFGFGGTNVHVVLEEAPPEVSPACDGDSAERQGEGKHTERDRVQGEPPVAQGLADLLASERDQREEIEPALAPGSITRRSITADNGRGDGGARHRSIPSVRSSPVVAAPARSKSSTAMWARASVLSGAALPAAGTRT